jgi:membrane fusion protein (multidrug efflux system)
MNRVYWIIFSGLVLFSCGKKTVESPQLVKVETYFVEPETVPVSYDFIGVCQSSHLVEIRARVQGYLKEVSYVEGGLVKEGDLLFKIDPRQFEAQVAEARANLEKENAVLWSSQKAVDRYKPLYEKKAASRKDWEDATSQLLAQQASVGYSKAKLDEALLNLDYTDIESPINGLTTNAKYQEGALITPGANDLLTTVSVIDPIWVVVNVSDYYFLESRQEIAEGSLVIPRDYHFDINLILADGTKYPYQGMVNFISPVLNSDTGTLEARAKFPNPDLILKPGQFVRAEVTGAKRPNAILVPQSSVVQGEAGRYVYVVGTQDKVEKREVVTGSWYKDFWIIKSGLKKGEEVIQQGVNKVKEGMTVQVTNRTSKGRKK